MPEELHPLQLAQRLKAASNRGRNKTKRQTRPYKPRKPRNKQRAQSIMPIRTLLWQCPPFAESVEPREWNNEHQPTCMSGDAEKAMLHSLENMRVQVRYLIIA